MSEFVTIQEHIERRTYLKGRFKGKFIGFLDHKKSDVVHESFYNLEVLSGEIFAHKDDLYHWQTGEPIEFQPVEKFLTKLPELLLCEITFNDNSVKNYKLNLQDPKLSNYYLLNQVYEDTRVLGDITGDISGYIRHYDIEEREVSLIQENNKEDNTEAIQNSINNPFKTSKQTGRTETKGNYKRWEYYRSDRSTYWGDWIYQTPQPLISFSKILLGLLQLVFLLFVTIAILSVGWQLILPLIIVAGIFYLLSALQPVIVNMLKWLMRLIGLAFALLFLFGLASLFTNPINTVTRKKYAANSKDEVPTIKPDPLVPGDSIISHHRIWQDYRNNTYSGNIEVKVSDYNGASNFRNNISISTVQETNQYNYVISKIYDFDKNKLSLIYKMFDSLKNKHNFNESEFAEVITSCIQDIPYTLILDHDCNPGQYDDKFINNYLHGGGLCEGNVKYGILSPIEFMGTLIGDCDTRTLLLFTVLNHYNYDVVMLGSEFYKHSVIGINLPYNGVSKTINGKRYAFWETTAPSFQPGNIPHEISDIRFWNVILISNNQAI